MARPTPGKVPIDFLNRFVFGRLGAARVDVAQGPGVGRDFAAMREGDTWVVCSSDPVTGAREFLGMIAVNVATNDVSMSGIRPKWLSSTVLMPLDFGLKEAKEVFRELHNQAKSLSVMIVGGHTEYVDYLSRPIVIVTAIGASKRRPKLPSDTRPGDLMLLAGGIGIEGTAILASDRGKLLRNGVSASVISRARRLVFKTSVMSTALELSRFDCVRSMHDPTEGGLIGGIYEMSVASGLGFRVDLDETPITSETRIITEALKLDPYKLISSGSVLASCSPEGANEVLSRMGRKGVSIRKIGEFTGRRTERVAIRNGRGFAVKDAPSDELWRAIG